MRVTLPRNKEVERYLEHMFYERVEEDKDDVTYEGIFPLAIYYKAVGIPKGKFKDFYDRIKVEGGSKMWYKDRVTIDPYRRERIDLRISSELLELLKKLVKTRGTTLSRHLRLLISEDVRRWLEAKRRGEESQRRRRKTAGQEKRDEERIYR